MNERRWIVACLLTLAVVGAYLYVQLVPEPPAAVPATPLVDVTITPSEPPPEPATPAPAERP